MFRYFIFNKPYRVLSQFSEEGDKQTLADFFTDIPKDVYPIGRLDYDSEGLLLLTNDKKLTHELLNPAFAHERTYWAQVEGEITEEAIAQLEEGVTISVDGKKHNTLPAKARQILPAPNVAERNPPIRYRASVPDTWLELTITEGKNRQVRKMTAAVGFPTLRLIRYSIGDINIEGIASGEYREMDARIKDLLLKK